uniref:Damage-inducible protein DinB n=1 Tax=Percolomonas cosmopolitus TaxID=63605 RepID=A0A7S1KMY4_9EUKA
MTSLSHLSTTKLHFLRMSVYHKHATEYLFSCLRTMPRDLLKKDLNMYFSSIHGCMVHIFLADHVWLSRINQVDHPWLSPQQFQELWSNKDKGKWQEMVEFDTLEQESLKVCEQWVHYVSQMEEKQFMEEFAYQDSRGTQKRIETLAVLGHVFNHSTHHRGQVSGAIHQLGYECDKMDLLYLMSSVQKEIDERFGVKEAL